MHMPPNYMFKFFSKYNKTSIYKNEQIKKLKKFKKKLNFYVQIIRILKSILYVLTNRLIIVQKGNHRFMRKLLIILLHQATPVQEILEAKGNLKKIDEKFKQTYKIKNVWKYIFQGYKSYGLIKTKKKNSIKRKLYKRVYLINPRFI